MAIAPDLNLNIYRLAVYLRLMRRKSFFLAMERKLKGHASRWLADFSGWQNRKRSNGTKIKEPYINMAG